MNRRLFIKTGIAFYLIISAALVFLPGVYLYAGGQAEHEGAAYAEDAHAERIISLAPGITETIFAVGAGELLAGRTDYCDYPPEAADIRTVGPILQPNIELIVSLQPDLVIASTHAPKDIVEPLERSGIRLVYLYLPGSFDGLFGVIEQLGVLTGREVEAASLSDSISRRYELIRKKVAGKQQRPSVYYVIGFGESGDWTAGGDTFISQMIETAGGRNIAEDVSGWSFSREKLVEIDPDIILVPGGMKDLFVNTPVYSELSACISGRVYAIDEDLIERQGPRLIDGIELMTGLFFPSEDENEE